MTLTQSVGQRLKSARQQKEVTQEQMGKLLNMGQPNYTRFERGIFQLNYEQMVAICRFLDVSADYLLGLSDY